MKHLIFLFIVSLSYGNFSYQSLLLPHSTYDLVSGNSKYSIFDKFLSNQIIQKEISFSIFKLPQDVQITSMNYLSTPFNYYNYFNSLKSLKHFRACYFNYFYHFRGELPFKELK